MKARSTVGKEMRRRVYEKYGGKCAYCGCFLTTVKEMRVDHFKAFADGGEDSYENYMPSCNDCNSYKRSYSLEQFRWFLMKFCVDYPKTQLDRLALKYGGTPPQWDGLFYFEKN